MLTPEIRMPSMDSRARLMVGTCATILKRFYFLQREMVLMQAGWMPGTEHWQSKLLLPEFLWQDALIARDLRERVLELRYPERRIVVGDDRPLLDLWRSFRDAPNSTAFVLALHQAIKPALRKAYEDYLEVADRLDDSPTVRILKQAIEDVDEQLARWRETQADADAVYPEHREAAVQWARGVSETLARFPGFWAVSEQAASGSGFDPARWGGKPFQISRTGKRDKRFPFSLFPWPDSLDPQRGPGQGWELQVRQATHHLNEVWAAETAAACVFDLVETAPPDFLEESARWCYDEIRHCRMGFARFRNWGFTMSEMPMGSFSYDAGAHTDSITRLGIIYYFESTYIHTKSERTKIFAAFGDPVSSHDMDFDWADELIHSYYGTRWLKHFLSEKGDARTPNHVRKSAEACVQAIRARASQADRSATETLYQQTMTRARALARHLA
jgi:hypothetical protein